MRSKAKARFSFGVAVMLMAFLSLPQIAGTGTAVAYYGSTHLAAPLYGTTSYSYARGHAEYERCCGYRHFEVNLWNVGKLQGTTLVVYAGGQRVGSMRVGSGGRCYLRRDTRHGQAVPTLSAGDVVSVRTGGGSVVASGTLHRTMMM